MSKRSSMARTMLTAKGSEREDFYIYHKPTRTWVWYRCNISDRHDGRPATFTRAGSDAPTLQAYQLRPCLMSDTAAAAIARYAASLT